MAHISHLATERALSIIPTRCALRLRSLHSLCRPSSGTMTLLFSILLIGLVNVHAALASQCACATVAVNVRTVAGVGHHVLTTLQNGHCLTFKGHRHTVGGASWVNVDWHGRDGWIHSSYVHISTCSASHHPHGHPVRLPGCPHIITRAEWGARPKPSNPPMLTHTPRYMFIHHGATPGCTTKAACIARVKGYQNYHMDHHQWGDIGYSFVVGEDGNVYEARGWDEVGAHTYGYNSVGLAICVVGNFMDHVPNHAALAAVKAMIACGLANNKLTATYKLDGHRDVGSTSCPGTSFENLIKGWPHY